MKDRIFAVLRKPDGHGQFRCWKAFAFDTQYQDVCENFMHEAHHGSDYFFIMESQLERGTEYPYLYYLQTKKHKRTWVMEREVKTKRIYRKGSKKLRGYEYVLKLTGDYQRAAQPPKPFDKP